MQRQQPCKKNNVNKQPYTCKDNKPYKQKNVNKLQYTCKDNNFVNKIV